jgi:hypothetical protein
MTFGILIIELAANQEFNRSPDPGGTGLADDAKLAAGPIERNHPYGQYPDKMEK